VHRAAESGDLSGDVIAENVGERHRSSRLALARPHVQMVERARPHPNERLGPGRDGVGQFLAPQHLGPAMFPDHDRFHAFTIAIMPRETPLERPQAGHPLAGPRFSRGPAE
jgi:hypothetical protein